MFHVLDVKVRLSLALSMEKPRSFRSGTFFPRSSSSSTPQKLSACAEAFLRVTAVLQSCELPHTRRMRSVILT